MNCTPQSLIEASKCYDCIPPGMQGAVQTLLSCEWAEGGGGGICDDPVVADWLQRLADDFQPMPSVATITAVCDFCTALRVYGIMGKMLVVNPIIPDSFLAMRYPLIYQVGNGNSPFVNFNFVAADLDNNGLMGDNVRQTHFRTGFIPATHWATPDSGGLSIYESEADPDVIDGQIEIGCEVTASDEIFILATWEPVIPSDTWAACWDAASVIAVLKGDVPDFYSVNRTSLNLVSLYRNNTLLGTDAAPQAGNTIPDNETYFMCHDDDGVATRFSNKRVSFMAIHEGLDGGEESDFFNAVYDLRFALGGGYV